MITIEELKRVSVDMVALNEYRSTVGYLEIVMFALSQHEEINDLKNTLSEVENLAGAERGNICIRIIRIKDEIERLRTWQTQAVEDFVDLHKEIADQQQELTAQLSVIERMKKEASARKEFYSKLLHREPK